jgi:hypothetical protein
MDNFNETRVMRRWIRKCLRFLLGVSECYHKFKDFTRTYDIFLEQLV